MGDLIIRDSDAPEDATARFDEKSARDAV